MTLIASYFGMRLRSDRFHVASDINKGGVIDIFDLSAAAKNFGLSQLTPT